MHLPPALAAAAAFVTLEVVMMRCLLITTACSFLVVICWQHDEQAHEENYAKAIWTKLHSQSLPSTALPRTHKSSSMSHSTANPLPQKASNANVPTLQQ
jgi:hypothetical protein